MVGRRNLRQHGVMTTESGWFAVRCVFLHGEVGGGEDGTYEERITLWNVSSAELAIERAEAEADEYVVDLPGVSNLGMAQSYALFDVPGDGAEVFSLMRDSRLSPDDYLTTHFDTGTERQTDVTPDGDASR